MAVHMPQKFSCKNVKRKKFCIFWRMRMMAANLCVFSFGLECWRYIQLAWVSSKTSRCIEQSKTIEGVSAKPC